LYGNTRNYIKFTTELPVFAFNAFLMIVFFFFFAGYLLHSPFGRNGHCFIPIGNKKTLNSMVRLLVVSDLGDRWRSDQTYRGDDSGRGSVI
jgi:hypothetical protein